MYTWDSSLPTRSLQNGYRETVEDDVIAFPTEYGRPKVRVRSNYRPDRRALVFRLTDAQKAQLKSDWKAYIKGALSFQGPDFATGIGTITYDPVPGTKLDFMPTDRRHWHATFEVRS
jgi:hypothetical protein